MRDKGVVSAGHEETARAAAMILREGGNAFDAIIAAFYAACIAEPVLSSMGGGGFMLAKQEGQRPLIYDFFVHTPKKKNATEALDFVGVHADFGATTQAFHIGYGSVATPGAVAGMFELHRDLGSMPMRELVVPAIEMARRGVALNPLQHYILEVVQPIFLNETPCRDVYGKPEDRYQLIERGTIVREPLQADFMESLAREGRDWFYRGEVARLIESQCRERGGHLRLDDMASYRVMKRHALEVHHRSATIYTNPPPASGGVLITFGLELLREAGLENTSFGSLKHLGALTHAMQMTNQARLDVGTDPAIESLLNPELLERYRKDIAQRARSVLGTTHINVIDKNGAMACMTVSNGAAAGRILPGTGMMLNNMLGEEDLNPGGFHSWTPNQRMTSMMSPTLLRKGADDWVALGSGGSNRIRTAILQVLINLIDYEMDLKEAVDCPRLHYEHDQLNLESGFDPDVVEPLCDLFPNVKRWGQRNLFFGGTHLVRDHAGVLEGYGDPRRGGVCAFP